MNIPRVNPVKVVYEFNKETFIEEFSIQPENIGDDIVLVKTQLQNALLKAAKRAAELNLDEDVKNAKVVWEPIANELNYC